MNVVLKSIYLMVFFFFRGVIFGQSSNVAPVLTAVGNQIYCAGSSLKIVTDMTIYDPDDIGIDAIYIQVSSGYVFGQDLLTLSGIHPKISSSWNSIAGKLTLFGVGSVQPTYVDLVAAIKDVEFSNITSNPTGSRTFSITVGQANYLPSNQHYYQFIPNVGVTWSNAKALAAASTYYGLQGYLATITSSDEAKLSGEQSSGAGWIGGSDEQVEGVWKWMTGPEIGTVFWNGNYTGTTPNFAFWNIGEPNSAGDEDYAHITAPGIGVSGSWNDISNTGEPSGNYQPKGYIVEYGGLPGDPTLQISTSSTITIPSISSTTSSSNCGNGSVTLQANATIGNVNWYTSEKGGVAIATGTSFTTPSLSTSTTYYVDAFPAGCLTGGTRTPVVATINEIPIILAPIPSPICSGKTATILASTTAGSINWYASSSSTVVLATGATFVTSILTSDTTFYAEANNNGCLSARIPIEIVVIPLPNSVDETLEVCENVTLTLDAGVSGMNYLWSTGETSQTIAFSGLNAYSVVITNASNCSSTKNFSISIFQAPIILEVQTNELTATIITSNGGNFEYSIDGINYQNSNVFKLNEGGLYMAHVKETRLCGFDSEPFILLSAPKFFSPNDDGINDIWLVKGLHYFPKSELKIFDRYGKLIASLSSSKPFWDGTLNGKKLIADDYWYSFKINTNSLEKKGHFSLIR